jgi:hypothetical protein
MAGYRVNFTRDSRPASHPDPKWHINKQGCTEISLQPLKGSHEEHIMQRVTQAHLMRKE